MIMINRLMLFFILLFIGNLGSCDNNSTSKMESNSSTFKTDSISEVIVNIDSNRYWIGKAQLRYDTIGHINPIDLKETFTVLLVRIREGEWLLKEADESIIAKKTYIHDSLVSNEELFHYSTKFDDFNQPDTISVTTKW